MGEKKGLDRPAEAAAPDHLLECLQLRKVHATWAFHAVAPAYRLIANAGLSHFFDSNLEYASWAAAASPCRS